MPDLPRWQATHEVVLPLLPDNLTDPPTIPPSRVLKVSVVADRAFLDVCTYEEISNKTTLLTTVEADVDAWALLYSLAVQLGVRILPGDPQK